MTTIDWSAWLEEQVAEGRRGRHVHLGFLIAPELAKLMLTRNLNNRKLSLLNVRKFKRIMLQGQWNGNNGEGLGFDVNGTLANGQNRLTACVEANTPFRCDVHFGLPQNARDTIDQGLKRTPGHIFQLHGIKSGTLTAAVLRYLVSFELEGQNYRSAWNLFTPQELLSQLPRYSDLERSLSFVRRYQNSLKRPQASLVAAAHYLTVQASSESTAEEFWGLVISGLNLSDRNDPRYRLRERFLDLGSKRLKEDAHTSLTAVNLAWNAWRTGKKLRSLTVVGGEDVPNFI